MIDPTTGLDYNIFDLGFDRFLTKVTDNADELGLPSVMKSNATGITNPSNIASGAISQNISMVDGYLQSKDFVSGVSGQCNDTKSASARTELNSAGCTPQRDITSGLTKGSNATIRSEKPASFFATSRAIPPKPTNPNVFP